MSYKTQNLQNNLLLKNNGQSTVIDAPDINKF